MKTRLTQEKIKSLLFHQIDGWYSISAEERELIENYYVKVIEKLEQNFSHNSNKYYSRGGYRTLTHFILASGLLSYTH